MKTKILIFIIFLSFLNVPIFGQSKNDTVIKNSIESKYAIGVGAGFTTGCGISFKFTPNKFGIQTNFGAYFRERTTDLSLGLTLLYTLFTDERTCLYLYQGNHFIYFNYHNNNAYSNISNYDEFIVYSNGIGLGIEFIFSKHFSLNFMSGYSLYNNFEKLTLTVETGLYYKF